MKPRIAVSACLLGQAVRYDGGSKPHAWIRGWLSARADLVPLCPETGAGLGVPRPPVQLVLQGNGVRALGVTNRELDVTGRIEAWSRMAIGGLDPVDAVILKSRSPSCGLGSVPLHSPQGEELGVTSGLFAAELIASRPGLLVVEETELENREGQTDFCRRLGIPVPA